MQPFPKEFLEQLAAEKYLTDEQREAFVALFMAPQNAPEGIAGGLHISPNAFRVRLTGVYKAFGIDGKGSNKKRRLHADLLEMYRQRQGRDSDDPILDRGIDDFVERVRRQLEPDIRQRCGTMRVLDMAQPVGLGEIYTDVNILEKISRSGRKNLDQMHELIGLDLENFQRFSFGEIAVERVAGLDVVKAHKKLMIWGKPGAGKTTFLKHLAMTCIEGQLFPECVPLFVTLKSFAEEDGQPNLFTYLQNQSVEQGVDAERIKEIVVKGRAMIFLDGLDEVRQEDSQRVIKGIQNFADIWRENFFAITCRIAAKEYTFQGFTEVEVADFNQEQIACFVNNWFQCKQQEKKAEEFINALKEQKPIQELASSPLLLTLLCLVFEEDFHFPQNRAELYKEGLDILLKKWDGKRAIQRDEIYRNLTVKRREQMLSEIAFKTFEKGEYFFKQSRAENLILEFIQNLPDAKDDPEALRLDSEVVLKAIEAQHGILVERAKGIYSFSHLTFQEYLTAQYIANKTKAHPVIQDNFHEKRWREVILLIFGEINDSDIASQLSINLRQLLDQQMIVDPKHQEFLLWIFQKSASVFVEFHGRMLISSLRDFYIFLDCFQDSLDLDSSSTILDICLYKIPYFCDFLAFVSDEKTEKPSNLYLKYSHQLLESVQIIIQQSQDFQSSHRSDFFELITELNSAIKYPHVFHSWYFKNEMVWKDKLRQAMIENRNIGHDWQWTDEQEETLKTYWKANRLLLECLRSAYIRRNVREWIENTMFLPMSVIETMSPPEL